MKRSLRDIVILMFLIPILHSCLKDPERGTINIEKHISKELPLMYSGSYLEPGTRVVIRRQSTLDSVFTAGQISQLPELQNIDFTQYDVLAGADTYTKGIYELEHHLLQSANSIYIYKLYVSFDLTLRSGVFYFGIIINKLPEGSNVIFEISKLE